MRRLAILNDHERQALALADWSPVAAQCQVQVFDRPLAVPHEAAGALQDVEILCLVRERMALPAELLARLPALRFIAVTGPVHRTLDLAAASRYGIVVSHTPLRDTARHATAELTWGLILATARHIASSDRAMRNGEWPSRLGQGLRRRCLGLLGLGQIGRRVARIGQAFGMEVIAWSESLTLETALAAGVRRVEKDALFRLSDVLSVHPRCPMWCSRRISASRPRRYSVPISRTRSTTFWLISPEHRSGFSPDRCGAWRLAACRQSARDRIFS